MAIQVIGVFKNPSNQNMYGSPILELAPYLAAYGRILLDVNVVTVDGQKLGAFPRTVDREKLVYDPNIGDAHDAMLEAIHQDLLTFLKESNPGCTYERYSKPIVVPLEEPEDENQENLIITQ